VSGRKTRARNQKGKTGILVSGLRTFVTGSRILVSGLWNENPGLPFLVSGLPIFVADLRNENPELTFFVLEPTFWFPMLTFFRFSFIGREKVATEWEKVATFFHPLFMAPKSFLIGRLPMLRNFRPMLINFRLISIARNLMALNFGFIARNFRRMKMDFRSRSMKRNSRGSFLR